jgi:hypothetical protein
MEIIKPQVSPELKSALEKIDLSYFKTTTNNLINHRVFYCNKWTEEQNKNGINLMNLLKEECQHLRNSFETNTLIQLNVINAPPDCNNQLFHMDYQCDSNSYFIPLVELSDLNGTEYLYFYDSANYIKYYKNLLQFSDNYLNKQEIVDSLFSIYGLKLNEDFCFKCANSDPYALIYMPYYVYHRGQKNKTSTNRLMLNILFSIENKFTFPIEEYILDAEIDEEERAGKILEYRKNNIIE